MRLIDADALGVGRCNPDVMLDPAYADGWNGLLGIINAAPTIDPVHQAGGCYCRECRHKDTTNCPAYDAPMGRTSLRIKHCSEGEPKEAQDA